MIRRYLDNYKTFKCIAEDCPDTCCSGWLIEIDENSLGRFEKVAVDDGDFFDRVNFSEGCFFQTKNKDCAFLLENGLCKMQKEYGEEMLCYTCDMYPRHVEEFPDVREYSLSASCPVVAKDIVEKMDYISYTQEMDSEQDTDSIDVYEDYNELLYEKLLIIRDRLIIALKGEGSFDKKAELILDAMGTIQKDLDMGMYEEVEKALANSLDRISTEKNVSKTIQGHHIDFFPYLADLSIMHTLEPLREEFVSWVQREEILLGQEVKKDKNDFMKKYAEFERAYPQLDLIQCNVAIYFIFTYFCGAVYDNYVYSAARLAVYSARVIKVLSFAKWEETSDVDIDIIIYKFCRELEHSNDNLNLIKQELDLVEME